VLGRGGCSVNRNHTCFKLGSDDPEEVKATFEQTHVAENANSLGAHHVPNKGYTNEPGFDFRDPSGLKGVAPCDPHGRPVGHAHEEKYWKGNTNQVSIYREKDEHPVDTLGQGLIPTGPTWLEPAIHASNRSTCNQECFDWHEHVSRGEANSPSKALDVEHHHNNINYHEPEKCHNVHDMTIPLGELTNEECEPRHQRIRSTPTFQSSAFLTDPLPHRNRTSNTFESHILGGDVVNNPTNWKQDDNTRRKWLAPPDHMADMLLGSGNPKMY